MLKNIELDKKPNGKTIFIPVEITASTIQQQIKIIIEWADYIILLVRDPFSSIESYHHYYYSGKHNESVQLDGKY